MRGSYQFRVRSRKTIFEFTIRRNITVIKGDSATGKTTLLHMLYEYLRVGRESGYSVYSEVEYYVYLRREVGRSWQDILYPLKETIIFIEENNEFVFSKEFADFVKNSGNYFVLVNRSPLKMLPYSIHEIYEIITEGKRADVRESYHQLKELYSNYPLPENNKMKYVVTEDSNSGFQFFAEVFRKSNVVSAGGNSNVITAMEKLPAGDTLIIVDGASFGAIIEACLEYFRTGKGRRVSIWMPESFEYLILRAGLIQSKDLEKIFAATSDYVEAKEYESWERYFTHLLTSMTRDTPNAYSKSTLNKFYITDKSIRKMEELFPVPIRDCLE